MHLNIYKYENIGSLELHPNNRQTNFQRMREKKKTTNSSPLAYYSIFDCFDIKPNGKIMNSSE